MLLVNLLIFNNTVTPLSMDSIVSSMPVDNFTAMNQMIYNTEIILKPEFLKDYYHQNIITRSLGVDVTKGIKRKMSLSSKDDYSHEEDILKVINNLLITSNAINLMNNRIGQTAVTLDEINDVAHYMINKNIKPSERTLEIIEDIPKELYEKILESFSNYQQNIQKEILKMSTGNNIEDFSESVGVQNIKLRTYGDKRIIASPQVNKNIAIIASLQNIQNKEDKLKALSQLTELTEGLIITPNHQLLSTMLIGMEKKLCNHFNLYIQHIHKLIENNEIIDLYEVSQMFKDTLIYKLTYNSQDFSAIADPNTQYKNTVSSHMFEEYFQFILLFEKLTMTINYAQDQKVINTLTDIRNNLLWRNDHHNGNKQLWQIIDGINILGNPLNLFHSIMENPFDTAKNYITDQISQIDNCSQLSQIEESSDLTQVNKVDIARNLINSLFGNTKDESKGVVVGGNSTPLSEQYAGQVMNYGIKYIASIAKSFEGILNPWRKNYKGIEDLTIAMDIISLLTSINGELNQVETLYHLINKTKSLSDLPLKHKILTQILEIIKDNKLEMTTFSRDQIKIDIITTIFNDLDQSIENNINKKTINKILEYLSNIDMKSVRKYIRPQAVKIINKIFNNRLSLNKKALTKLISNIGSPELQIKLEQISIPQRKLQETTTDEVINKNITTELYPDQTIGIKVAIYGVSYDINNDEEIPEIAIDSIPNHTSLIVRINGHIKHCIKETVDQYLCIDTATKMKKYYSENEINTMDIVKDTPEDTSETRKLGIKDIRETNSKPGTGIITGKGKENNTILIGTQFGTLYVLSLIQISSLPHQDNSITVDENRENIKILSGGEMNIMSIISNILGNDDITSIDVGLEKFENLDISSIIENGISKFGEAVDLDQLDKFLDYEELCNMIQSSIRFFTSITIQDQDGYIPSIPLLPMHEAAVKIINSKAANYLTYALNLFNGSVISNLVSTILGSSIFYTIFEGVLNFIRNYVLSMLNTLELFTKIANENDYIVVMPLVDREDNLIKASVCIIHQDKLKYNHNSGGEIEAYEAININKLSANLDKDISEITPEDITTTIKKQATILLQAKSINFIRSPISIQASSMMIPTNLNEICNASNLNNTISTIATTISGIIHNFLLNPKEFMNNTFGNNFDAFSSEVTNIIAKLKDNSPLILTIIETAYQSDGRTTPENIKNSDNPLDTLISTLKDDKPLTTHIINEMIDYIFLELNIENNAKAICESIKELF